MELQYHIPVVQMLMSENPNLNQSATLYLMGPRILSVNSISGSTPNFALSCTLPDKVLLRFSRVGFRGLEFRA